MKKFFSEKTTMSFIMIILICFLIVAGTAASFLLNEPAGVEGLNLKIDDIGMLHVDVKIEPYTVNLKQTGTQYSDILTNAELINSEYAVLSGDGQSYDITRMSLQLVETLKEQGENVIIDMGQPKLNSIEDEKLGPGAYGEVVFYILSLNEMNTTYSIQIEPVISLIQNRNINDDTKEELNELVADHIRFYEQRKTDATNKNVKTYNNRILYYESANTPNGFYGVITPTREEQVTLYWCWPYEYTDIPEDGEAIQSTTSYDIESYDLGDTKIGNFVTNISFNFNVTGDLYQETENEN